MAWKRTVIGKTSATVGDSYRTIADLILGIRFGETALRIPNGTLFCLSNGMTVAYGQPPIDLAAGAGAPIAANAGIGLQSDLESAWDLSEIWVRNTTPGSNAVVQVNGPVFKEGR